MRIFPAPAAQHAESSKEHFLAQVSPLPSLSLGAAGSSAASPVPALSWEGVSEPKTTGLGLSGFSPMIARRQPAPAVLRDRGTAPAAPCEAGLPGGKIWGGCLGNQQPSRLPKESPQGSAPRGQSHVCPCSRAGKSLPFGSGPQASSPPPPQACAVLSLPITALRWVNPCSNTARLISALAAFRDQEEADAAEPQSCMLLRLQ